MAVTEAALLSASIQTFTHDKHFKHNRPIVSIVSKMLKVHTDKITQNSKGVF